MHPRIKGKIGEELAKKFLEKKGFKVLAQNYTIRGGEIDIIAQQDKAIIFVEVKSRRKPMEGYTLSITKHKKKCLYKAALNYLHIHGYETVDYVIRFDVIFVINSLIDHFENAF